MNSSNVPKIIHQIWLEGEPLTDTIKDAINSIKNDNLDFKHILWTNENLSEFGLENILSESLHPAFASNIMRLKILEKYGGIYIDADNISVKGINPLYEKYKNNDISSIYIKNRFADAGIIFAKKGIDINKVLVDYKPFEPIGFYLQRLKPVMIEEELVGKNGEFLKDLRLNSWVKTYRDFKSS